MHGVDVLDLHALNRTTLARQHLLERAPAGSDPLDVLDQVGGLQAQLPAPPMLGLWSRVAEFERRHLLDLVAAGEVVRGTTLRGTLHLVTAREYRRMRLTLQPVLEAFIRTMGRRVREQDVEPALELGRSMFDAGPRQVGDVKRAFEERFPDSEAQALANIVRMRLPLLIVPDVELPDGWAGNAPFAHACEVVGDTLEPDAGVESMVPPYLRAFGPASPADMQVWSGLRGCRAAMESMRANGELSTRVTHEDVELLDMPDEASVRVEVAAPVRFLPRWDNLLLSHADRSRVLDPAFKPRLASSNGMSPPVFLVDGFAHGTWSVEHAGGEATLLLERWMPLTRDAEAELVREGEALVEFLHPGATPRIVVGDVSPRRAAPRP